MLEIILVVSLFFGPSVLASRGVGYRGAWFGLATLALILSMGSCLGSCAVVMTLEQDEVLQDVSKGSIVASMWFGVTFLGCLLAGFFYREKRKAAPSVDPFHGDPGASE